MYISGRIGSGGGYIPRHFTVLQRFVLVDLYQKGSVKIFFANVSLVGNKYMVRNGFNQISSHSIHSLNKGEGYSGDG